MKDKTGLDPMDKNLNRPDSEKPVWERKGNIEDILQAGYPKTKTADNESIQQSVDRATRARKNTATAEVDYLTKYGGRIATLTEIAAKGLPEGGGE